MKREIHILDTHGSCLDTLSPKLSIFLNSTQRSWNAENMNIYRGYPEKFAVVMNPDETQIIVFNAILNETRRINVPLNSELPIAHFYFHNYDSIFLFYDLIDLYHIRKIKSHPDFILIDSSGKQIDTYSFPEFFKTYNGEKEGFIYREKYPVYSNRIVASKFYIPFAIYGSNISNSKLKGMNTELLCEFDLIQKSAKMLPIKLPDKDIGRKYKKNVGYNSISFIIHDNNIIYGFQHCSDLYVFNLSSYKTTHFEYPNDILKNLEGIDTLLNNYYSIFKQITYIETFNIYLRLAQLVNQDFPSKSRFLLEVFDSEFNFLGYNYKSDTTNVIVQIGQSLSQQNKNDKNYFLIDSISFKSIDKENFLNNLFIKDSSNRAYSHINDSYSLNHRLDDYYYTLGIGQKSRVFQVNTNMNCKECLSLIVSKINKESSVSLESATIFVFYGDEVSVFLNLLNNYGIKPNDRVILDLNGIYKKFFKLRELTTPYLLREKNGSIVFVSFDNIERVLGDF